MNQTNRIAQLEDEVRELKAQLELERKANAANKEMNQYQTQLETIVADKTFEVISRRVELENLSLSQAILIKVLKIVQTADDLPQAMNQALAEIGKYTEVSRIHAFEKNADGTAVSCFMGWCNDGIESIVDKLQNIPVKMAQAFINMSETGEYVSASDDKILAPELSEMLIRAGVKSVIVFPLSLGSVNYGFVVFDECIHNRKWDENELELLKNLSQIISTARNRFKAEQDLIMERDRIQAIGDNFPEGSLFRYEVNPLNMDMRFSYLSATWEKVMGITIEETMADASKAFDITSPECIPPLMEEIKNGIEKLKHLLIEIKIHYKNNKIKWIQISSHPKRIAKDRVVFDGFILDVTRRKENEIELAKHHEKLEFIVKERTEELQVANEEMLVFNEELQATNQELYATNEELQATSEELFATNEELEKYKSQLEEMVAEKTSEVILRQRELKRLNRRQGMFINVMQILQLEEEVSKGMNIALDIIGRYTRVDRVQIWENNTDGITYGCSYEWCNKGIDPVIHFCQNLPLEYGKPWFDLLDANKIICTSDIYSLAPEIYEMLERQRVKSIVVLPMSVYGSHFGFLTFTVCEEKPWEKKELELLSNIAQVFSNVIRRRQVETAMNLSQQIMRTVLDNINANIFVSEFDSLKILFANNKFIQEAGEDVEGKFCWRSLNAGLDAPCKNCPRSLLLDDDGHPTGIHFWEDYNPITKRWYVVMSAAIKWVSGKLAIMELATDITDRKLNEIELVRAREKAEESDQLKSAFLANMSHEIRTPLNAIVGFLNIISSEDMTPEREQNFFDIINSSASQLVQLIDDIIDVAKIEAKQMNILPVSVNINQLMYELQIVFEAILQTKNKSHIMLILDDKGFIDNCVAMVDPMRLRQVLNNLIGNAIKYTEKGYIRFGYRQSTPGKLEFEVEDTGIGLADSQHEIIFERFRQAGDHFRGGTGLGLNISMSLVQMMGGDIWVESTEGIGSIFYFTISYLPAKHHLEIG